MDPYMSIFFMLTISFPEAMLMSYFVIQFMGGRPRLLEVVLIGLIQMIVAYIVRTLPIPMGLHTILLGLSCTTLIYLISRIPFLSAVIGFVAGITLEILQEVFVMQTFLRITGLNIETAINNPYMRVFIYIPIAAIMLVTIILFKRYDITFARITRLQPFNGKYQLDSGPGSDLSYKEYLPAVIFIFLPVFLLFLVNFSYVSVQIGDNRGQYPVLFKFLFNGLILTLAFMSLWAMQRIRRSIEKEFEAKNAAKTIEHLKELILSIRKQRHDFNHQLQAVYGLIETGNYSGAREYIQNTYHYVSGTGELIKTDNPPVSALLYSKIGIAETMNTKFDISIECSLEEFPLKSNEASSLLGNLIDNAFDAVEKNGAVDRLVRLNITSERGEYLIELANRGELDPLAVKQVFKPNFTTKNGHAGLGLTIVKEIVIKYKGTIQLSCEGGETIFRVNIPLRR